MYERLGIHWGSSVWAFLAVACLLFPWIFYKYGPAIRRHCRYAADYAQQLDAMADRMRAQAEQRMGDEKSFKQFAKLACSLSVQRMTKPVLPKWLACLPVQILQSNLTYMCTGWKERGWSSTVTWDKFNAWPVPRPCNA